MRRQWRRLEGRSDCNDSSVAIGISENTSSENLNSTLTRLSKEMQTGSKLKEQRKSQLDASLPLGFTQTGRQLHSVQNRLAKIGYGRKT